MHLAKHITLIPAYAASIAALISSITALVSVLNGDLLNALVCASVVAVSTLIVVASSR